jgi:hypothetical protein
MNEWNQSASMDETLRAVRRGLDRGLPKSGPESRGRAGESWAARFSRTFPAAWPIASRIPIFRGRARLPLASFRMPTGEALIKGIFNT